MDKLSDFKNRFKNKGVDEELVQHILESFSASVGIHTAISKLKLVYPQLDEQDIDDLIGRYATSPFKYIKKP